MEEHDLTGTGIPAALSATRPAARIPQGALLRTVEPGKPGYSEAVAVAAGAKASSGKRRRTGEHAGFVRRMSMLLRRDGCYQLDPQIEEPTEGRVM